MRVKCLGQGYAILGSRLGQTWVTFIALSYALEGTTGIFFIKVNIRSFRLLFRRQLQAFMPSSE